MTSESDAEGTASFTYDSANELTGVSGSRTESYSYDLNGNRNSTGYTTGTENEQTASPGSTYTYDNAGNMISSTDTSTHVTTTYTYDYRNRLTGVEVRGTIAATYTYDALNDRIGIDDNGTQEWTVYDGTNPYADFNGSGTLEERYQSGPGMVDGAAVDELLARTSASSVTAWYLTDKLGSVRDIASSSGGELDHVVYDSFGNIVTETNASEGDRFKFAGMEYDAAIGQYYDRARWYAPATGRFDVVDPTGFGAGDSNLYRYASGDPLDSTDPTGLQQQPGGNQGLFGGPEDKLRNCISRWYAQYKQDCVFMRERALAKIRAYEDDVATIRKRLEAAQYANAAVSALASKQAAQRFQREEDHLAQTLQTLVDQRVKVQEQIVQEFDAAMKKEAEKIKEGIEAMKQIGRFGRFEFDAPDTAELDAARAAAEAKMKKYLQELNQRTKANAKLQEKEERQFEQQFEQSQSNHPASGGRG